MTDLVVRSERVVLPNGTGPATLYLRNGRIDAIGPHSDAPIGIQLLDAGALVVMPGLVDTHVHINDPGRTHWEGFESGTRAAAAGGVTTIVDMPLNSIPATTTPAALDAKRRAATGRCHVDVGFWGGVVPGNTGDLAPLVDAGVLGFKCFLSPSGVEEFEHVGERELREAMPVVAGLGVPLLAHAELPALLCGPDPEKDPRQYSTWLASRPPVAEHGAIDLLVRLSREYGTRVHIVHLASADALPAIAAAKASGAALTIETCPHYLSFAAEDIGDGATAFKCAPPIRDHRHRAGLWNALEDGLIDLIGTDHSPAPPDMKKLAEGDFIAAWGGIASLQIGLAAVWTKAAARGIPIERVSTWMARAPAVLAGIAHRKGTVDVGRDADLIIWDPEAEAAVDGASLYHRHAVTPYHGARLRGVVHTTILRGHVVFANGECRGPASGDLVQGRQRSVSQS